MHSKFSWVRPAGGFKPQEQISVIFDAGFTEGLIALVDKIPLELLSHNMRHYAELVLSVEYLRQRARLALGQPPLIVSLQERNALNVIWAVMEKSPDSVPSASAFDPSFISDLDLRAELHRDISEVERALQNGEWKGATVLAGSVVEALLLWALQNRKTAAEVTAAATTLKISKPQIERWDLAELTPVAHALGLITERAKTAADQAREFRNLIHPGRSQRLALKCDRATALLAAGALEAVLSDLS
jgi:hypothetical protein